MTKYKLIHNDQEIEFLTIEAAQAYADENSLSVSITTVEEVITVDTYSSDYNRFAKRAAAKSIIIAEMATENMARVRNGTWTTSQLISLTQDAELKNLLGDVESLSYEIAASKIMGLTNALLTSDIKASWIAKLQSHFYL
jgi:hypothetical protein